MDRSHLSKNTVLASLENLEKLGYILVTRGYRKGNRRAKNHYHLQFQGSMVERSKSERSQSDGFHGSANELYLDKSIQINTPASPLLCKSNLETRKPGKKHTELSVEQKAVYHAVESRLQGVAKESRITWDHGREGKKLHSLVEAYTDRLDSLPGIVETFLGLRSGKAGFWKDQPPTPSALLSVLSRVENESAKYQPRATDMKPLPTCPACSSPHPEAAQTCPRCGIFLEDAKGTNAESFIAIHRARTARMVAS